MLPGSLLAKAGHKHCVAGSHLVIADDVADQLFLDGKWRAVGFGGQRTLNRGDVGLLVKTPVLDSRTEPQSLIGTETVYPDLRILCMHVAQYMGGCYGVRPAIITVIWRDVVRHKEHGAGGHV